MSERGPNEYAPVSWTRREVKEVAIEAANEAVAAFRVVLAANVRKLAVRHGGFITGHDAVYHSIANMIEEVDVVPDPLVRSVLIDDEHLPPAAETQEDECPDSDGSGCEEDS